MPRKNKISAPPAYTSQAPMGYLGPQQPYPMGPPAPQQPYPMGPPAPQQPYPMGPPAPQQLYPMGPPAPQQPYPMGPPAPQQPYPMGLPPPTAPQQRPSMGSVTLSQTVVVNQPAAPSVTVVQPVETRKVGSCPVCKVGKLSNDFTCCGICLGIFLFPCGLICCCAMRQRRCNNCKANFG